MTNRQVSASVAKSCIAATTLLLAVAFGAFWASWRTPYFCDDNTYRVECLHGPDPCRTGSASGLESEFPAFSQKAVNFIKCGVEHYRRESGRFLCAVPLRLAVAVPRWAYGIVNGVLFALMCVFVWRLSGLSRWWLCLVVASSVFALFKADAVLWLAASVNYLWPSAFVLGLAAAFVSGRAPKTWWMALPCMLAAGGHEIVSAPVCVVLGAYWIRRILAERRVTVDGRFMMTVGFVAGTVLVFLSPASPIARLHGESSSAMSYKLLCKVLTLSHCVIGSPFFVPTYVLLLIALFVRRYRSVFSGRSGWAAFAWVVVMAFTLVFGNICARASWPANVMTVILFFAVLPKFAAGWRQGVKRTLSVVMCALAIVTLVNTAISSSTQYSDYESSMADYTTDKNDIYKIPYRCDWLLGFLFDRSVPPLGVVQVADGESCTNGIFARLLGRRRIIGLHGPEAEAVKSPSKICVPENRLNGVDGAWYAAPGIDLLVSPMTTPIGKRADGVWRANVEYWCFPPPSSDYMCLVGKILADNLKENLGGWAILRTMTVFEDSGRDILYTSLYRNRPLKGFELETDEGRFLVFVHNHFADRSRIAAVKIWQ